MDCRNSEKLISVARDGMLADDQQTALAAHLESCSRCQQFQQSLSLAAESLRSSTAAIDSPDSEYEWRAVRRRIRAAGETSGARGLRNRWVGLSLGTVAAAASVFVAAFLAFSPVPDLSQPRLAEAEYVEVDDSASVVVFVDEESGWLVVWTVPEFDDRAEI